MTDPPAADRPVFLVGSMGAGKSTVGRELARRLAAPFVDLDARIETIFGETIAEIFGRGEPEFRRRERAALTSLLSEPGFRGRSVVVATGGGVVLDPRNVADLRGAGLVIHLDAALEVRVARMTAAPGQRPLLAGGGDLRAVLAALDETRRPIYESAAHRRVDGDPDVDTIVRRVLAAMAGGPEPEP